MNSNIPNINSLVGRMALRELYQQLTELFGGSEGTHALFDYPLYQQNDGKMLVTDALVVSPALGLWVIFVAEPDKAHPGPEERAQIISHLFAKLIRNPVLRKKTTALKFDITEIVFDPIGRFRAGSAELVVCRTLEDWQHLLKNASSTPSTIISEMIGTLDGSKAIVRPKDRQEAEGAARKGNVAKILESEMALLDNHQRRAGSILVNGPQRIRGMAGTGKTVVLAMKAAFAHLRDPDATIVYTFYTKSLYQHVKRLITRFYRQFSDKDPDWSKLYVMHGWGGKTHPGVYYDVCRRSGSVSRTYTDAQIGANKDRVSGPFDWACRELIKSGINPCYDYVFIDEGQDFPNSFIDLCRRATTGSKIVWAYDEMQNIFDTKIPTQDEVFGQSPDGSPAAVIADDIILYKSYRNPREILIAAHAFGFGIYSKIVQMLESRQHWEDLGYAVISGECKPGETMTIERPKENSSDAVSQYYSFGEIISCASCPTMEAESELVATEVDAAIEDGLRPDDILIAIVDDRHAKSYADLIETHLAAKGVACHSLYRDKFDIVDFNLERSVTISTIHKAKGNEAFQVFVVGVDALYIDQSPSARNKLFTAITRAKGWVRITGVGEATEQCSKELAKIEAQFPRMVFIYPDPGEIKVMQRDLTEESRKRMLAERQVEELLETFSEEDLRAMIKRRK